VFLAVLLVSAVLNAAYFLPVVYTAFFEPEKTNSAGDSPDEIHPNDIREIPLVTIPLVVTALLSLVMGIFPDYFLTLARGVVP
ncbi:MAG: monovalent cation/H+ antiporter subunit D family protein, partial [Pseudomonadota bacterium]|nr:monovalent cation/H+ antiporter subunit D family protein [Pseudomonadota bacterium]